MSTRLQLPVLEHHLVKLPGANGEFRLGIHDVLHSRELKQAVYRKLAPGLMYRYGVAASAVEDLPGVPAPRFFFRPPPSRIRVQLDGHATFCGHARRIRR